MELPSSSSPAPRHISLLCFATTSLYCFLWSAVTISVAHNKSFFFKHLTLIDYFSYGTAATHRVHSTAKDAPNNNTNAASSSRSFYITQFSLNHLYLVLIFPNSTSCFTRRRFSRKRGLWPTSGCRRTWSAKSRRHTCFNRTSKAV